MSDSCDFTAPPPQGIDAQLAAMNAEWARFARYAVYRFEHGQPRTVLFTGRTLVEAKGLQAQARAALQQEPGYRGGCTCSPGIGIELEDAEATTARYRARHAFPERKAA